MSSRKSFYKSTFYVVHMIKMIFSQILSEPPLIDIIADESTENSISISWEWPKELESNITGFIIQYRPASSTEEFINSTLVAPSNRTFDILDLLPGEQYEVQVLALSKTNNEIIASPERIIETMSGKCNHCLYIKVCQ